MVKVILDTNFLIYCAKNNLHYVEELNTLFNEKVNLVVPKQVIVELGVVINKKKYKNASEIKKKYPLFKKTTGKDKEAAKLSLLLLKHNNVEEIEIVGETVDDAIVNFSNSNVNNVVATLDREMRGELPRVVLINRYKKLILAK